MIRSCKDIKTKQEFKKFTDFVLNTIDIGLRETAVMLCWGEHRFIDPERMNSLYSVYPIKND